MAIIVQKYGGSSVSDVSKIREVAKKVTAAKRGGDDVVVVVSAMGKTTDELLRLAKSVAEADGKEAPRRELDMLVSTGERVSMALLSIAICDLGFEAISFTGSQSGIITNDRHFDARIIEVRPHRIEDELARGKIVIVAGYQGMSYKREITTLGRGGSDTTAVALAAALGASRCEIYSDVDGVYSADPRVVPDARHLPALDLAVLQEMAEAGAKVVCAQAVEWARRAKIAIHARKTTDDWSAGAPRETVAREAAAPPGPHVRAVVGCDRVVVVRADSAAALVGGLTAGDLPFASASLAGGHARAIVPLGNLPDWGRRRGALALHGCDVGEECARVSVVGAELASGGAIATFLRVLGDGDRAMTADPLRLSAIVPRSELASAQQKLHEAFRVDGGMQAQA